MGFLLSLSVYAYPIYHLVDNQNIISGVFFASIINAFFIGTLSILFSLFIKRFLALISMITAVLFLSISSLIGGIVIDSPLKSINKTQQMAIINATNNALFLGEKKEKVSVFPAFRIINVRKDDFLSYYDKAIKASPFLKLAPFNIAGQFASLFILGKNASDLRTNILTSSFTNGYYKILFEPTLPKDIYKLRISLPDLT